MHYIHIAYSVMRPYQVIDVLFTRINALLLKLLDFPIAIRIGKMKMLTVSHSFINLLVILLSLFSYENDSI